MAVVGGMDERAQSGQSVHVGNAKGHSVKSSRTHLAAVPTSSTEGLQAATLISIVVHAYMLTRTIGRRSDGAGSTSSLAYRLPCSLASPGSLPLRLRPAEFPRESSRSAQRRWGRQRRFSIARLAEGRMSSCSPRGRPRDRCRGEHSSRPPDEEWRARHARSALEDHQSRERKLLQGRVPDPTAEAERQAEIAELKGRTLAAAVRAATASAPPMPATYQPSADDGSPDL